MLLQCRKQKHQQRQKDIIRPNYPPCHQTVTNPQLK